MTPEKELRPCPFCSCVLSKDGDSTHSFCGNVNCPFSGIDIPDDWWKSAFCWKELDAAKAEIAKKEEPIRHLQYIVDVCIRKEKEISAHKDTIKVLREGLESISKNTCCGTCQEAALWAKVSLVEADQILTSTSNY